MPERPGQWPYGRADVEELLNAGHLAIAPDDKDRARELIDRSRKHLRTAQELASSEDPDTETAADALHSANRKACEAVLLAQGLESTKAGGHVTAIRVVREQSRYGGQSNPVFQVYETVRQLRHAGDYGNLVDDLPADDILDNLDDSAALIDVCEKLVEAIPIYVDTRNSR